MLFLKYLLPKLYLTFADGGTPAGGEPPAPVPGDVTPEPEAGSTQQTPGSSGSSTVPLAALQEERTKRQTLQHELEHLKTLVSGQPQQADPYGSVHQYNPQAQPAYTQQQPSQQVYQQQLQELWETNPQQAVSHQINGAFAAYDQINTFVENQVTMAESRYNDFGTYREQVRNYINTVPVTQRGRPGLVDAAYYMVKGQNADTLAEQARAAASQQAAGVFNTQQPGAGVSIPGTQPRAGQGLSQEERNVARVMGMTEEEYLHNKR